MKTLQPVSAESLPLNPFTKIGEEWGLVTAGDENHVNTMTVSWGGLGVIWGKNVVYIFIRSSRYTKEFLDQGEVFSLAFLDSSYHEALSYAGSHTGRGIDKFAACGLTPADCGGIPYPAEADLVFLCRKMAAVPIDEEHFTQKNIAADFYGDHDFHTMYIGEIVNVLKR